MRGKHTLIDLPSRDRRNTITRLVSVAGRPPSGPSTDPGPARPTAGPPDAHRERTGTLTVLLGSKDVYVSESGRAQPAWAASLRDQGGPPPVTSPLRAKDGQHRAP